MIGVPDPILGEAREGLRRARGRHRPRRTRRAEGVPEPARELHGAQAHRLRRRRCRRPTPARSARRPAWNRVSWALRSRSPPARWCRGSRPSCSAAPRSSVAALRCCPCHRHVLRLGQPGVRHRVAGAALALWACDLTERPSRWHAATSSGWGWPGACRSRRVTFSPGWPAAALRADRRHRLQPALHLAGARRRPRRAARAEPREAFDGGPYGLTIHQRVIKEGLPFLKPGGWLLFEIGVGQQRQVKMLFERTRAYEEIRTVANAACEVRVVAARKINPRGK